MAIEVEWWEMACLNCTRGGLLHVHPQAVRHVPCWLAAMDHDHVLHPLTKHPASADSINLLLLLPPMLLLLLLQVLGEDLKLVLGQQDRMQRGGDTWANPVSYDKLAVRYR
jgi:hypothetical protein